MTGFSNRKGIEFLRKEFGFTVRAFQNAGDFPGVRRISIERAGYFLELLPSKGLSIGTAFHHGTPIFWDPPLQNLPDPESVDLTGPLLVDGESLPGMGWIRYFTGGVEMLGLRNWGMPRTDVATGEVLGLHGEVSTIPAADIDVSIDPDIATVSAQFDAPGGFRIIKRVSLLAHSPRVLIRDTILNRTSREQIPDWGYHIQLFPESGARYIVPSKARTTRNGGAVDGGFMIWEPATGPHREERGYLHVDPVVTRNEVIGGYGVTTLLRYPDGRGTSVTLPLSAYLLSWCSCGGAGSDEFLVPSGSDRRDGQKVLERNWDGIGPELGSSSLDHNGLTSTGAVTDPLPPGGSLDITIAIESVEASVATEMEAGSSSNRE